MLKLTMPIYNATVSQDFSKLRFFSRVGEEFPLESPMSIGFLFFYSISYYGQEEL